VLQIESGQFHRPLNSTSGAAENFTNYPNRSKTQDVRGAMHRVSEKVRSKKVRLQKRRRRKLDLRRQKQRFGYIRVRARGRARRPLVDRALFEASAEGIASVPVVASYFQDAVGRSWRCRRLSAPAEFSFAKNPDGVLEFVYELRRQVFIEDRFRGPGRKSRPSLYIDLDRIENIDIEGALILVAELDRVRKILKIKPRLDDAKWDPDVRAYLASFGFYRVLEASQLVEGGQIDDIRAVLAEEGYAIVPFVSCHQADPRKALELRDGLLQHCAPPDAAQRAVYESLIEAFLNAVQHAYRHDIDGDGLPSVKHWWATALVDKRHGDLYLAVYDQGVGIPRTLVKRPWWHIIAGKLPERSDASIIEGALEYGRSGTSSTVDLVHDAGGRGNGLWRMCELTEAFKEAEVRFTSLKGDVLYRKGGALERTTLRTRFCGTMITWRAQIAGPRELMA
jgi:hypothetical protein